jgi:colicin import membrane protein
MKKLIVALLALLPSFCMAQSNWEVPEQSKQQQEKKALFQKKSSTVDAKYLEGAIPVVDGKVTFTLNVDAPGKDAQQIYETVYGILDGMTKEEKQFKESKIALVDKTDHVIAARFREWLVFKSTALSLDRTVFNYTIIANCSDGHLHLTLSRINYAYELDRDNDGMEVNAEEWITDENALNKAKTKLLKYSGKFRRKTIDRKDEIFENITNALK